MQLPHPDLGDPEMFEFYSRFARELRQLLAVLEP